MKSTFGFIIATLLLGVSSNGRAQIMAERSVTADHRATFTVRAPGAKIVKIINLSDEMAMGGKEYTMHMRADSVWEVTTNPCRPGFHYYELSIDGFRCADPSSELYFGWGKWTSGLEIPDNAVNFYTAKEVPHGDIRIHTYFSSVTKKLRKSLIYVPAGYDANTSIRYPVLYLQHGAGESELGWTMQGKVNLIMDNLIAEGKAKPMIIVMDNGYAPRPGAENKTSPRGDDNLFAELMLNELVPMIDREYRTIGNSDNRAIAGLSMGAGQAMQIGLAHLDIFGSIGAFSGGGRTSNLKTSFGGVFQDSENLNKKLKLFWIGCGTLDGGYSSLIKFHELLDSNNIRHTWYSGPGSHEWQVWRRHLYEFTQLLFR